MLPEVRKALDQIEDVLLQGGTPAANLWDILSALRGPDDLKDASKTKYTVPIRRHAFPRIALSKQAGILDKVTFGGPGGHYPLPKVNDLDSGSHYLNHITDAVVAIEKGTPSTVAEVKPLLPPLKLEVGKKYVARARPEWKYVEIVKDQGDAALNKTNPFLGVPIKTLGGVQLDLIQYSPSGQYNLGPRFDESRADLVAEYIEPPPAPPVPKCPTEFWVNIYDPTKVSFRPTIIGDKRHLTRAEADLQAGKGRIGVIHVSLSPMDKEYATTTEYIPVVS